MLIQTRVLDWPRSKPRLGFACTAQFNSSRLFLVRQGLDLIGFYYLHSNYPFVEVSSRLENLSTLLLKADSSLNTRELVRLGSVVTVLACFQFCPEHY